MADSAQIADAWGEVRGQSKPDAGKGVGQWLWEAIQGDFHEDRTGGQIAADMVISLIPIVDTICDIRDLCANIRAVRKEPNNKLLWFFIVLTLVGFIPEIGSIVKGVIKIAFAHIRRYLHHVDELTDISKLKRATEAAVDAALPKISEFLSNSSVIKWATRNKVPDIYKFVARELNDWAGKLDVGMLRKAWADACEAIERLLKGIRLIVPAGTRQKIDDFLTFLNSIKRKVDDAIAEFLGPIRTILRVIAKKLDNHAWIAFTQVHNKGWIAPISQEGAAALMRKHPPTWAKLGKNLPHPGPSKRQAEIVAAELEQLIASRKAKGFGHPPALEASAVQTFEKDMIRATEISGPATLYRIVDPTNAAGGIFWVDEKTFRSFKNRGEWRERSAVKPEWNQNGQYVTYEVQKGETLHVWRGPAASQELKGTPYHLEGGADQIVFTPSKDIFVASQPRVDPQSGATVIARDGLPDTRVEWKDVTGRDVVASVRDRHTDPHVKGPFETNWGYADWDAKEAKRITLALPDDIQ